MGMARIAVALALLLAAGMARAQAAVEAVQYPAWLERGGRAVPLPAGAPLQPRDRIRTGDGARARVALGDGGTLHLGENAEAVLEPVDGGRTGFAVHAGAFRHAPGRGTRGATVRAGDAARPVREAEVAFEDPGGARGWRVIAAAFANRDEALLLNRRLRAAGYPAVVAAHGPYFVVQLSDAGSEAQARSVMARMRGVPGVELPSVGAPPRAP